MGKTKIEWADSVWNPVTGCSKVSAGCAHCYAERMARRLHALGRPGYTDLPWTEKNSARNVFLHKNLLDLPLRWKRPRRIFVNSMSDLFHERVPFEFIKAVFNRMVRAHHHTFQVLTKRPAQMLKWWAWFKQEGWDEFMPSIPPHIWLGVSVEDQRAADERIPLLLEIPAAVHFLSCEPLLGPLDLGRLLTHWATQSKPTPASLGTDTLTTNYVRLYGIDWVIGGGESGPHARPCAAEWAASLRDQCAEAKVPFFWKQWGEWLPFKKMRDHEGDYYLGANGQRLEIAELADKPHEIHGDFGVAKVGKQRAGHLIAGIEHYAYPTVS